MSRDSKKAKKYFKNALSDKYNSTDSAPTVDDKINDDLDDVDLIINYKKFYRELNIDDQGSINVYEDLMNSSKPSNCGDKNQREVNHLTSRNYNHDSNDKDFKNEELEISENMQTRDNINNGGLIDIDDSDDNTYISRRKYKHDNLNNNEFKHVDDVV